MSSSGTDMFGQEAVSQSPTSPDLNELLGIEEPSAPPEGGAPAAPQAPVEPVAPAAPVVPPAGQIPPEQAAVQAPPAEGVPPQGQEGLILGRFQTQDDLIAAYNESVSAGTRNFEALRAAQTRNVELEQAVRGALPIVQQVMAERQARAQAQPGPAGQAAPPVAPIELDLDDPAKFSQQVAQLVEQRATALVEARMAEVQGEFGQQMQQSAEQAAFTGAVGQAVQTFFQRHPEVTPNGPVDVQIRSVLEDVRFRQFVDPRDPEQLDIVYEAVQNPLVARNLAALPHLIGTREGREMVRMLGTAPAPGGNGAPVQQAAPVTAGAPAVSAGIPPRPRPHTETGGTGAPVEGAPGARPGLDPAVAEILAIEQRLRSAQGNVYGN